MLIVNSRKYLFFIQSPMKRKRTVYAIDVARAYKKRRVSGRGQFRAPRQRVGYGSVQRARGAAVTGEMKYYDTESSAIAIALVTTTWVAGTMADPQASVNLGDAAIGTPLCLFAPKVSAALNGRIGRKVKMMKVRIKGMINVPVQAAQAAADTSSLIRLCLVLDTQTNAAQMTGAQLFNDTASGANATVNSMQNPNNFGRFRILKEKTFIMANANLVGSPTAADVVQTGLLRTFKMSCKFKVPIQVNFNATNGGTVADLIDNSLHIVCGANNITYAPTLSYYTRTCYKE